MVANEGATVGDEQAVGDAQQHEGVEQQDAGVEQQHEGDEHPQHEGDDEHQQHEHQQHEPAAAAAAAAAEAYEDTHVHAVYDAIAPHFSSTRHKPWPLVTAFLLAQPPGSIGLDVGCGNGKYLHVNPCIHLLCSDRSAALARLAHHDRGADVLVAHGLALPYRPAAFDFAMSIAVVHHLATPARRRAAIAALVACLRPDARALIYVWALEQAASRRGWDQHSLQDTLVPWVTRAQGLPQATYQRYYHLYRQGELEQDVRAVGATVVDSGYEKDNWWVICSR